MNNKSYNGWTNYETWLVALHIDNDQTLYNQALNLHHKNSFDYSQNLELWFEELIEWADGFKNTLVADLIRSALMEVNWMEIAKHYQETFQEIISE